MGGGLQTECPPSLAPLACAASPPLRCLPTGGASHSALAQGHTAQPHPAPLPPRLTARSSSRSFRPPFRLYPLVEDDMYSGDKVGGRWAQGGKGCGMGREAKGRAHPCSPTHPSSHPCSPTPTHARPCSPTPPTPRTAHALPAPAARVSRHQDSHGRGGDGAAAALRAARALRDGCAAALCCAAGAPQPRAALCCYCRGL